MATTKSITVQKLDAAKRQLQTAIELWFADSDIVSIHTLACASHQIIHDINTHNLGDDLIFDSIWIKDEYRNEYVRAMKKAMNFFKHAVKDPDPLGAIEFSPKMTELFLLFSILGINRLGNKVTDVESAFLLWYAFHNPGSTTKLFRDRFMNSGQIEKVENLKLIPKNEFLKIFLDLRKVCIPTSKRSPHGA